LKLNGKIIKKTDEKFYFDKTNWKKNFKYKGELESEKGEIYKFEYRAVKFSLFNLQIGLNVSFDLTSDKNGNEIVKNIDKFPVDYGFLVSHDEREKRGLFKAYKKESIEFSDNNVREEDEPIFDSLYVFDTIINKEEENRKKLIEDGIKSDSDIFEVGQIRRGTVKTTFENYAFINIGHPTSNAFLHWTELVWSKEKVFVFKLLRIGQSIDVLITKIETNEEGKTKIELSMKALIELPTHRAYNIFRINKMHPKIINDLVSDIASRDNILPEVKIRAIYIIKNNPDLYKQHRDSTLPILYEYCKQQLLHHLSGLQFDMAFYLLQEYATYDISILELLDEFPQEFLSQLNSSNVNSDIEEYKEDLEPFLLSIKNQCEISDTKEYLDLTKNIFDENNLERIEILKHKIGLKPSIILDGANND